MKKLNLTTTKIKEMERSQKKGKFWSILAFMIVISIITGIFSSILELIFNSSNDAVDLLIRAITGITTMFLTYLLSLIIYEAIKNKSKGLRFSDLFEESNNSIGKILGATALIFLLTVLGVMFLIIPGIILLITFSHTIYVIKDTKGIGIWDAMKVSFQRMKGNSMLLFLIYLRYMIFPTILFIIALVGTNVSLVGTVLSDFMGGSGSLFLSVLFGIGLVISAIFLFAQRGKLMIAEAIFHNEIRKINEEEYPEHYEIISEEKRDDEVIKL